MTATREPASGRQIELVHGTRRAVVVETGGGLRAYEVDGRELLDGYSAAEVPPDARGQVLIPWPNRLRDGRYRFDGHEYQLPLSEPAKANAIHGLVRWANWTEYRHDAATVTMTHVLNPREGYPFRLALAITYALGGAGLEVTTTATNAGDSDCPAGAGWHPYLRLGSGTIDGLILRAPGAAFMPTDDRGIPTGVEPVTGTRFDFRNARAIGDTVLDTGYAQLERDPGGRAEVELTDPATARSLTLWLDGGYTHLMLFTGDSLPEPARRRHGLGVEPMTCAPNALASGDGVARLRPGDTLTAVWGIAGG